MDGDFNFRRGFYNFNGERVSAIYVFRNQLPLSSQPIDGGLLDGDIIIAIKALKIDGQLLELQLCISPGEILELTVIRNGEEKKLEIITKKSLIHHRLSNYICTKLIGFSSIHS